MNSADLQNTRDLVYTLIERLRTIKANINNGIGDMYNADDLAELQVALERLNEASVKTLRAIKELTI